MALRPSSAIALLLPVLLLLACRLNMALASSGGVMGGDFFDSDSSSSDSSMSDPVSKNSMSDPVSTNSMSVPVSKNSMSEGDLSPSGQLIHVVIVLVVIFFLVWWIVETHSRKYNYTNTLCMLQVAVFVRNIASSIQRDLTRIGKAADTSSREETIEALDRQPSYCIAGYASFDLKRSREDVKKCFNQLSNEERRKFDEETLVNLTKVKRSSVNVFSKEDTLVTILVATEGAHKFPNNNGAEDLKKALQKLSSILLIPSKLLAGKVIWTPQKEGDTLSEQKLLEDYPHLADCMKSFRVKKEE